MKEIEAEQKDLYRAMEILMRAYLGVKERFLLTEEVSSS